MNDFSLHQRRRHSAPPRPDFSPLSSSPSSSFFQQDFDAFVAQLHSHAPSIEDRKTQSTTASTQPILQSLCPQSEFADASPLALALQNEQLLAQIELYSALQDQQFMQSLMWTTAQSAAESDASGRGPCDAAGFLTEPVTQLQSEITKKRKSTAISPSLPIQTLHSTTSKPPPIPKPANKVCIVPGSAAYSRPVPMAIRSFSQSLAQPTSTSCPSTCSSFPRGPTRSSNVNTTQDACRTAESRFQNALGNVLRRRGSYPGMQISFQKSSGVSAAGLPTPDRDLGVASGFEAMSVQYEGGRSRGGSGGSGAGLKELLDAAKLALEKASLAGDNDYGNNDGKRLNSKPVVRMDWLKSNINPGNCKQVGSNNVVDEQEGVLVRNIENGGASVQVDNNAGEESFLNLLCFDGEASIGSCERGRGDEAMGAGSVPFEKSLTPPQDVLAGGNTCDGTEMNGDSMFNTEFGLFDFEMQGKMHEGSGGL